MLFFFFKQKTAYEMRISDWSSDVCSSDLPRPDQQMIRRARRERALVHPRFDRFEVRGGEDAVEPGDGAAAVEAVARIDNAVVRAKIGEAAAARAPFRSEERRVGKESGSTCRSRWSTDQ